MGWSGRWGMIIGVLAALSADFALAPSPGNVGERLIDDGRTVVGGKSVHQVFPDARVANLAVAACDGDLPRIHAQLVAGADPNAIGFQGLSPLLWAERCENIAGMRALLQAGANPNYHTVGKGGFSAVFMAASVVDRPDLIRLLLEFGGDPNDVVNDSSDTSLGRALEAGVQSDDWTIFNMLLDAGADINREYAGTTIVEQAALLNQFDRVEDFLKRGYSHNLPGLVKYVEGGNFEDIGKKQQDARLRVVALLRGRGIVVGGDAKRD